MTKAYEGPLSTKFIGTPSVLYDQSDDFWVVDFPRTLMHHHTYGLLTPFFKGLTEGRLLATKCTNPECTENSVWLPPRADCPDCYARTEWVEVPSEGTIYAYTMLDYAGIGIEMETPYWQVDVAIEGVDTVFKGWLKHGKPVTGMPVKAEFRTENPTHTILDICWVPKES